MAAKVIQSGVTPAGIKSGIEPSNTLVGKEGFLVNRTGGAGIALVTADTDRPTGIVVNGAVATSKSDFINIVPGGEYRAATKGVVSEGDEIAPDATGAVKTAQTGDTVIGIAQDAGADAESVRFEAVHYYTKA